jgi:DNA modification methylase
MTTYSNFLAQKAKAFTGIGHNVSIDEIHPLLFPFQRDLVVWAVRKGRCAIFADTGLGKTLMQLEWARLTGKQTLIIAPLSVARQTVREAHKIGLEVHYVRHQSEVSADFMLCITNYEMIDHFEIDTFGAVVLDECFVGDTPIDTNAGTKRISEIRPGDMVYTAIGLRPVVAVRQRHCDSLVLTSIQGRDIISSYNHPYLTTRGWVCACDLREGDGVVYTSEAMRVVRGGFDRAASEGGQSFLRDVLLSEMADAATGDSSKSTHERDTCCHWSESVSMVAFQRPQGKSQYRENPITQSCCQSISAVETVANAAQDRTQAKDQRGQWTRPDNTPINAFGGVGQRVGCGISCQPGQEVAELSHSLQGRPGVCINENCDRSGWIQPCGVGAPNTGCEERGEIAGARVDSVTIYKSDDPIFARYRDATGLVVLYDIQVEGHPSYSVHGLLVHNSSILKAIDGKTRTRLIAACRNVPYRLCCTATPAPNDFIEIGNHAHFLDICTTQEMLAMFFINANKEHSFVWDGQVFSKKGTNAGGTEWRLKRHAEQPFFKWLSSWAITLTKPSDLGYDDNGFILPALSIIPSYVETNIVPDDRLMFTHLEGVGHRATVRRATLDVRLGRLVDTIKDGDEQWIVWCGLDAESKAVAKALPGAVEVTGSDSPEKKAQAFEDFQDGKYRIMVTKCKIGGFGMNFQNAHQMAFFGLNDSWEMWYQAIRRQWRFGQTHSVDVYVILADIEAEIYANIQRKEASAMRLRQGMIDMVRGYELEEVGRRGHVQADYSETVATGDRWTLYNADSCEHLVKIADDSIDLSVYSPPFADLYTYSASERDLGNNRNWDEFFAHYAFVIQQMLRVTKPGRLTCVHTSDIAAMKQKDGYIGVRDFPGDVIRAYQKEGWIFTGRALVQKNPQAQAIRIHASSLLFVQMRADSTKSRPALVDHVLFFKKPGENAVPVTPVENGEMRNETWIEWANGIWVDIRETDTLQYHNARNGEHDDKHICPLQLETIKRCVTLYSNPGETVLDPFAGIGSTGYVAVQHGRRFIGIELKPSYWTEAKRNLETCTLSTTNALFDLNSLVVAG